MKIEFSPEDVDIVLYSLGCVRAQCVLNRITKIIPVEESERKISGIDVILEKLRGQ